MSWFGSVVFYVGQDGLFLLKVGLLAVLLFLKQMPPNVEVLFLTRPSHLSVFGPALEYTSS